MTRASLNKLAIRGIRSFDDKHVQVIEFYSPLTVIVGHNGSGKTTIIETLKYATTGDFPPNTRNGAFFVHDPKIASEKEVKAQVRLRFWNVNRQRMTATRNLQVTLKKGGGLTMKSLEGILAKNDLEDADGRRNTISTKCSEMDEEVPLLLGVSKSILENVIFCHQEESNWPLSEPAALKKKFDEIFEATKYTKALDNIKALRKERSAELKVDQERLKHLKSDKDKAQRLRKQLEGEIRQETDMQTEAERLKEEFEALKALNLQHYAEAAGFQSIFEKVENLKARKSMLENNRKHILDGISEMEESTDELTHMLRNFDAHLKSIQLKRSRQLELKTNADENLDNLRRRERSLAASHGGLVANRKIFEKNARERETAVREAAKAYNHADYDYSPLEEAKVVEFMDKLHELVRKSEVDLKKVQADGARRERDLQAELDRLASVKTSAQAMKRSKQDQVIKLQDKVRASESNFDSVSNVDVEIGLLGAKIAEAEESHNRHEQDIRDARFDEQLRQNIVVIRQKEQDRDKISSELSVLNRQSDSRAQLAIKRNELQSKSAQISASLSSHATRFKELVGATLEAETMEEKITLAIGRKDREVQEAESSAAAKNRSLSQLQTTLSIAKRSLKERIEELSRLEKHIQDGLSGSGQTSVEGAIEDAEAQLVFLRQEINEKKTLSDVWQQFLDKMKANKKCMACDRPVHDTEHAAVERYLTSRIVRANRTDLNAMQAEEQEHLVIIAKRRELLSMSSSARDLKQVTIPNLSQQVEQETRQLEKMQDEVEEARQWVQRARIAARDLQTLKGAAVLVSRTLGETADLKSDISRLERDLASSGSLKTIDDVQQEVVSLSNEIKGLQREQQGLSLEKDLKLNAVRSLVDDINRKTLRLEQLKGQQEKRSREETALNELHESLVQLQTELKDLDNSAQAAETPWREKHDALNRLRAERQSSENEASLNVGMYQSSLNELESKHRACQDYIAEGNDRKMSEHEVHMEDLKREIAAATDARGAIEVTISSLQDELRRAESLKTNISANLRYRNEEKEIEKVQIELDGLDVESAAKARREFNTRYKAKLEDETNVQNRWQLASGQLMQMVEGRKKTESTLKMDYKNIDKLFKDQLIKTKVSEFANNDLDKYGKALDNAILKYHSIKMDEINDTIGHLWNKTYQGTDIDGIRIVSDHDESSSTSTRKSYNYRVVMVKNDVELDMRGRCSAGQKVLASIIIRLALAESFGQGCGVLALDEPTTNLDQENINALAEALAEIIRERRRQANFQLIVITHDEGFLQRLAAHDVLEYYWRVSRDASQKSVLERQRVGL